MTDISTRCLIFRFLQVSGQILFCIFVLRGDRRVAGIRTRINAMHFLGRGGTNYPPRIILICWNIYPLYCQVVSSSGPSGHNVEYVIKLAQWLRFDTFQSTAPSWSGPRILTMIMIRLYLSGSGTFKQTKNAAT